MAKLTFYFCDLCKTPSKDKLGYCILLCKAERRNDPVKQDGDICEKCYKALSTKLEQEAEPVLPRAEKNTPSEKAKPPVTSLSAIGIVAKDDEQYVGKAETIEYDGPPTDELLDCEISYQPSNFTLEKKREYLKTLRDQGCQHKKGVSMDEDGSGFTCLECREKVRV